MSFLQDKIYPLMPVPVQNLMISGFGYYWQRRRFGGIFDQELKSFRERESFTSEQWQDYQVRELRRLLVHSYETVPFYNHRLKASGLTLRDLKEFGLEDLDRIPVLTKDDLRMDGTSSLLSSGREKSGRFFSSSGSTGTPTNILFSELMHQRWSAAFEARIRNWAGVTHHDSRGMIGGRRIIPDGISRGPYHRINYAENQIYFSAYHISPDTAIDYAVALLKFKPAYMTGYAMSNYILAEFFLQKGINVPGLKAVITSSEKLTSEMRDTFLKVYGCKTFDSYSGVEACGLISENEYGQLLVSPDVGIIEILNNQGKPCHPGEEGEIYSTGLLNYDQPLIRYKIGDRVKIALNQNTQCGRNMMVIDEIAGRSEDIVRGADGRQMVRFHGLYININGLIAGQLIQHTLRDFTIRLHVNKSVYNSRESEKVIVGRLKSQLGEVNIKFEYPDHIDSGPNGKFKAVISELPL